MKEHSLPRKTLLRFIAIVMIPTVLLYFAAMLLVYRQMITTENTRREYQLSLMAQELDGELQKIEIIPNTLAQSQPLLEYLTYPYQQIWEAVYAYLKDVRSPLYYTLSVTPSVRRLTLYGAENMLNLGGYFLPLSCMDVWDFGMGGWKWTDGTLAYYKPIWSNDHNALIGVMKLELSEAVLDSLSDAYEDSTVAVLDENGAVLRGEPRTDGQQQQTHIDRANVVLAVRYSARMAYRGSINTMIGMGLVFFVLLLVLMFVYLRYSYRMAMRLSQFARHIRGLHNGEYQTYDSDREPDEIGEVISSFNHLAHRTDILVNRVQQAELLRQRAEYNAYQAQIEPHFLYGTLDSIRMLADENGDGQVAGMILRFAKLMRYTLAAGDGEVTLRAELDQVKRYLDLQMMRYGQRIEVTVSVAEEALLERSCPQYILQPLVENSLVHGLKDCTEGGRLLIEMALHGEHIAVSVSDNGAGVTPERLEELQKQLASQTRYVSAQEHESYALMNIHKRLAVYFGGDSGVRLSLNAMGGLTCTLWMDGHKENA